MLTQDQARSLIGYHLKIWVNSGEEAVVNLVNAAYAAGAKDMQERDENAIGCLLLDPYKEATAADALASIRALKETK